MAPDGQRPAVKPLQVYLADDHEAILNGLEYMLIEADFNIVGRSRRFTKSLQDISNFSERIDILVTDLSFPDGSGVELISRVRNLAPALRIVVHTGYASFLDAALRAGADGYVLKSEDAETVLRAVQAVARGERYLSPAVADSVVTRMQGDDTELDFRHAAFALLSPKERAILPLLHLENQEIADQLAIPLRTVEGQINQIRKKLNKSRMELVRLVAKSEGQPGI